MMSDHGDYAGWTAEKPTVPGWYWWEVEEESGVCRKVVEIQQGFTFSKGEGGRDVLYVVGYGGLLEDKPGLWLGPITPDTFQQGRVAGLREAGRKASDAASLLLSTHPKFANVIADAMITPDGAWVKFDAAQQQIDALQRQVADLTAKLEAAENDRDKAIKRSSGYLVEKNALRSEIEIEKEHTNKYIEHLHDMQTARDTLRAQVQQLREALTAITQFDQCMGPTFRGRHKSYISDDNWWAEKRPNHSFEAWLANAALGVTT